MVIIQIEHIDAVRDIDNIFAVEGIDAFVVGPYDLSGSMGKPGQFHDKDVEAAIAKVLAAAKRHKIPAGFHSVAFSTEQAIRRRKQGFKFLGFSLDSIILGESATQALKTIKGRA